MLKIFYALCLALLSSLALADLSEEIAAHCEAEWPSDFQMQSYCADRQMEGVKAWVAFMKRYGIEGVVTGDADEVQRRYDQGEVPIVIVYDCWEEWKGDYQMMAYCIQNQEQAAKKLGKL